MLACNYEELVQQSQLSIFQTTNDGSHCDLDVPQETKSRMSLLVFETVHHQIDQVGHCPTVVPKTWSRLALQNARVSAKTQRDVGTNQIGEEISGLPGSIGQVVSLSALYFQQEVHQPRNRCGRTHMYDNFSNE